MANKFSQFEIIQRAKASIPVGSNGQIAPVNDGKYTNLLVRKNGVLAPATPFATTEPIAMTVDPTSGTSPDATVQVTSQAEYDALGSDLLYLQDIFDILPHAVGGQVTADLKAGTYVKKAGQSGIPGFDMILMCSKGRTIHGEAPPYASNDGSRYIYLEGSETTVLEAAQGGTSSGDTIVRSSGTWTAHEHRGSFAYIVSGPGAGQRIPISDNDATTLYLIAAPSATGSITFEIVEPAAVVDDPTAFYSAAFESMVTVQLEWIKFGSKSSVLGTMFLGGNMIARECQFNVNEISTFGSDDIAYTINLFRCYIYAEVIFQRPHGYHFVHVCVLETKAGENAAPLQLLGMAEAEVGHNHYYAQEGEGFSGALVSVTEGSKLLDDFPTSSKYYGDGTATALRLANSSASMRADMEIYDCATAWDIDSSNVIANGTMTGSGNTTVFDIDKNALVSVADPSGCGGTTEVDVDGTVHTYTELSTYGYIVGADGSKIAQV